jgi:hypothetical protein
MGPFESPTGHPENQEAGRRKRLPRGEARDYVQQVERLDDQVTHHLRDRILKDEDNQRLLDGIGLHHDRGNPVALPARTACRADQQPRRTRLAICGDCSSQRTVSQERCGLNSMSVNPAYAYSFCARSGVGLAKWNYQA